jgi:hypothetical protein
MKLGNNIDKITERAKSFWPFKGIEQRISLATILLTVMGVALSISLKDWQYFERSGSLIVILGIIVAWKDIAGDLEVYFNAYIKMLAKNIQERESNPTRGLLYSGGKNSEEKNQLESYKAKLQELDRLMRLRLKALEVCILILGTFVWGYGDLIGNLLYEFND